MGAVTVELTAYEQLPPGDPIWHIGTIDLGDPHTFLAWVTVGYISGFGGAGGPWDFDNSIVAEIYLVDGSEVPISSFGLELGPPGSVTNLHQMAYIGYGTKITFRLRVWQTEEMSVAMKGIVLYDI